MASYTAVFSGRQTTAVQLTTSLCNLLLDPPTRRQRSPRRGDRSLSDEATEVSLRHSLQPPGSSDEATEVIALNDLQLSRFTWHVMKAFNNLIRMQHLLSFLA